MAADIRLLKWMTGFDLALTVAIVGRLFLDALNPSPHERRTIGRRVRAGGEGRRRADC